VADEPAQAVVRIVQEGLTNIVRHAGASRAELAIVRRAGGLHVTLSDNGRGRDGRPSAQAGCGFGLAGMAERVAALGGQLEFTTRPAAASACPPAYRNRSPRRNFP
jgi:two-component system sensor histidine kinase UhpB